MKFLAIKY